MILIHNCFQPSWMFCLIKEMANGEIKAFCMIKKIVNQITLACEGMHLGNLWVAAGISLWPLLWFCYWSRISSYNSLVVHCNCKNNYWCVHVLSLCNWVSWERDDRVAIMDYIYYSIFLVVLSCPQYIGREKITINAEAGAIDPGNCHEDPQCCLHSLTR